MSTLDQWLSDLEGWQIPGWSEDTVQKCAYCSASIKPGSQVTIYLSNKVLNPEIAGGQPEAPFSYLRTYCPDCDRYEVKFPCTGFHELITSATIHKDGTLTDWEVEDFSKEDEGVDWDPKEVWQAVFGDIIMKGVSWEDWLLMNQMGGGINPEVSMGLGPEDIVDAFHAWEVSVKEVVDDEGNIDLSDGKREELEKHADRRAKELAGGEGAWNQTINRGD